MKYDFLQPVTSPEGVKSLIACWVFLLALVQPNDETDVPRRNAEAAPPPPHLPAEAPLSKTLNAYSMAVAARALPEGSAWRISPSGYKDIFLPLSRFYWHPLNCPIYNEPHQSGAKVGKSIKKWST